MFVLINNYLHLWQRMTINRETTFSNIKKEKLMNEVQREVARMRKKASMLTEELRQLEAILANQKDDSEDREVIYVDELAAILGKSVTTIRRWISAGKLDPYYRKGRSIYWLRKELPKILVGDD